MKVWKLIRLGLLGLSVSIGVSAQTLSRAPSAEEACLTPGPADRRMPEYPKEALARRDSRTAEVELIFTGPDLPPTVKPLEGTVRDDFFASIQTYAQRFRVPCMAPGASAVRVKFTFDFKPNSGEKVSFFVDETTDARDRRLGLMRCIKMPPKGTLRYPSSLLRQEQQGVVLASLVFERPDTAPRLKVVHDGGNAAFVRAVEPFVEQMRLPCLAEGQRQETELSWIFQIEGGARGWIKDLDLMTFLGAVKDIEKQKVFFDFNTMKCPFVVSFGLRQPYTSNKVGTLGDAEPSRLQFVRWLEGLDLKIPARQRELIMANSSQIQVPCGQLDL